MSAFNVLERLARGQRDLYKLSQGMLREDKSDGTRWVNWMDKHDTLLRQIIDDARLHSDITTHESEVLESHIA